MKLNSVNLAIILCYVLLALALFLYIGSSGCASSPSPVFECCDSVRITMTDYNGIVVCRYMDELDWWYGIRFVDNGNLHLEWFRDYELEIVDAGRNI